MNTYFTKENDGDVVLFLHGWGADSDAFGALTMQLTNYKCISIDFWGFGKSSEPNDANGWSVVDYANNLAEFMTEHNLQYCNIVAHSFGGRVAIVLSALYPHLVKRLVLLSSAGLRRFSLKRFCKVRAYKFKKFLVRHNILSASRLIDSGSQDYKNCSVVMKKTFIKVVNQDLSRYARLIVAPTLIMSGREDYTTPLWMARRYNRLIKDSGLIVTEGEHFAYAQYSNRYARIIDNFFGGNRCNILKP